MLFFYNDSTEPFFNLALEEILLTYLKDDIFMLWRNKKAAVVGHNQNISQEVNLSVAQKHQIPVVRRITGGGAVFHDLGTINFSFITSKEVLVVDCLNSFMERLNVDGLITERNDVLINSQKIIGTAQYENSIRRLFHGSLLFNTDLHLLSKVLTPSKEKLTRNGVSSVSARVINLSDLLQEKIDTEKFITNLIRNNASMPLEDIPNDFKNQAQELAKIKYASNDWRTKL